MKLPAVALLSAALLLGPAVPTSASMGVSSEGRPQHSRAGLVADRPSVQVTAPREANEGDRITLVARVGSAQQARTVQLLKRGYGIFGATEWQPVRTRRVAGKPQHRFTVVATDDNVERYRVRVTYATRKAVASRTATVTVWRWVPLSSFRPYDASPGTSAPEYSSFSMNGSQHSGWFTYGAYPSWETHHTPGRNCRAFRGDLGVRDESADGSSAEIELLGDENALLHTSGSLTPGMVEPVEVDLPTPYRFHIRARNTSPDGVRAYPAIGGAEFLCTGI